MRPDPETSGQDRLSFIETVRRKQIVDTAITTIAARGYSKTSLAEIARGAGISKGVISYHFRGKSELVEEILSHLLREPAEFIKARVDAADRATDNIRAYLEANFEFAKTHRRQLLALVDLWGSRDSSEGRNRFDAEAYEPSRRYLSRILTAGIESGELRPVPAQTMASTIQAAIDGVLLQWAFDDKAVDLDAACRELQEMIASHVARTPTGAES